ncbi:type 1 glutamine amidotransferase [Amycolatopsis taiwanensis]|nr:type 1 glutamine amidotransferase [Amycolatopsis taiwanensis]
MSAPRLLIIQPDESDPVGPLGDWLTNAGAELDVLAPPADTVPNTADGFQGLVCLGGGMSAQDDAGHPWLPKVRDLLAKAVSTGLPTLGICLGAQLLAVAAGGRVEPGEHGAEVGAGLVSKRDAAWTDPLFADLPLMPDVMQFHEDVITTLPRGAVLLASAPRYPNQAFRLNRTAYGIQFHIETTTEVVQSWARDAPAMAATAREDAFTTETLAAVHADLAETWRPFATRFVQLCTGLVTPAAHPLPLT